jgi:hypothetical protein
MDTNRIQARIALGRFIVLPCFILLLATPTADAETRYFKVAEWPGNVKVGDSYLLPLTDPAHIAHAENLITLGPGTAGRTIPLARIAPVPDGINRDLNQPGHPFWSWHVTELVDFVDVTIEIYDGRPSMVEDDLNFWMNNTGGMIGFWSYTVVEDVTHLIPEPASHALFSLGGMLLLCRRRRQCAPSIRRIPQNTPHNPTREM